MRAGVKVFLMVAALGFLAGCVESPTRPRRHGQIVSLDITAVVGADGVTEMRADVLFATDRGGFFALPSPRLTQVDDVRINGNPRSDTASGQDAQLQVPGRRAKVEWTIDGAVERWADVAIVDLSLWSAPRDAAPRDPLVPFTAKVELPKPVEGDVHLHRAVSTSVSVTGDLIAISGAVAMREDSEINVATASSAFPALPLLGDEARLPYFEERQAVQAERDTRFRLKLGNDRRREDLLATGYWVLVGLEVGIPLLVVVWRAARNAMRRRRAIAGVPGYVTEPPGSDSPAVVALIHHEGHDIYRDAVAATVLDLANRRVVELFGVTSERFVLRVPPGATGSSRAEQVVIDMLRGTGDERGELAGPPLLASREGTWWREFRRDTLRQAKAAGLLRRRYPSGVFYTAVVLLTATTFPLWARTPELAFAGLALALAFMLLPSLGGYVLSGKGHRVRAQWEAFGRYTRDHGEIETAGPPAIAVWGPYLAYGAALGVAEVAAEALSPRARSRRRIPAASATVLIAVSLLAGPVTAQNGPCDFGSRHDFRESGERMAQGKLAGRDLSCQDLSGLDFTQADLTGSNLSRVVANGADFGQATLAKADLSGGRFIEADFVQTEMPEALAPGADFTKADLGQANLRAVDFTGAVFNEADLGQAQMEGAILRDAQLVGITPETVKAANLDGTPFAPLKVRTVPECAVGSRSTFRETVLDPKDPPGNLTGIDLSCQDLTGFDFSQASFEGASLAKANISGADFTQAQLPGVLLRGADGSAADFTQADLPRSDLREAVFNGADFGQAELAKSDARGARFDDADFTQAHIEEVDFTDASAQRANFTQAFADDAIFRRVDLTGAKVGDLDEAELDGVIGLPTINWWRWGLLVAGAMALIGLVLVIRRARRGIAGEESVLSDLSGSGAP